METLRRLLTNLKLRVNEAKSAVARPWERKFLGYTFWIAKKTGELKRGVADKALATMKERVRTITSRTRGRSIAAVIEDSDRICSDGRTTSACSNDHRCFENWTVGFVIACECSISSNGRTVPTLTVNSGLGVSPTRMRRKLRAIFGAGGATHTWRSIVLCLQAISTTSVCRDSLRNLNSSNRPVRTRMPGGVGGVWRGKSRHPYPDKMSLCAQVRAPKAEFGAALIESIAPGEAWVEGKLCRHPS
jgi:hypothetical protein